MTDTSRVYKPQKSLKLILGLCVLGVGIIAFIVMATWSSSQSLIEARKRGTIVEKKFIPLEEQQITVGKSGLQNVTKKGNFTITVRVPQKDGTSKDYIVEYLDENRYNSLKIGGEFDVGPYLAP